jgi:sortase A
VLGYPLVGTYYNDYNQFLFSRGYAASVSETAPSALQETLDRAHRYNDALPATLLADPWTRESSADDAARTDYLSQLADFDVMARVRVPSIGVDLPVLHGTSDDTLARGIGHLYGSSLPVGGPGTHAVLTGHSSFADATLFDKLPEVAVGDVVYIDVYGQTLAYRVDTTTVVLPDDLSTLTRTPGVDAVTLVTCTPRSINSHRLLVHALRIPYHPQDDPHPEPAMDWSLRTWMYPRAIAMGVATLILVAMLVGWMLGDRRRRVGEER